MVPEGSCANLDRKTYRKGSFLSIFLVFLGSGAWICQFGAWNGLLGAWNCLLGVWNCLLGVWNCLLGAWNCLLGVWICLLGAWTVFCLFAMRSSQPSNKSSILNFSHSFFHEKLTSWAIYIGIPRKKSSKALSATWDCILVIGEAELAADLITGLIFKHLERNLAS